MPRLFQVIAAVLTLTAWLGASQHCNLEAAGVFGDQTETDRACCPDSKHGCNTDGCHVVESDAYRLSESNAVVALPASLVCYCHLCLALVTPPTDAVLAVEVGIAVERIKPWLPIRHFDRRAVAAPGAPALILA